MKHYQPAHGDVSRRTRGLEKTVSTCAISRIVSRRTRGLEMKRLHAQFMHKVSRRTRGLENFN